MTWSRVLSQILAVGLLAGSPLLSADDPSPEPSLNVLEEAADPEFNLEVPVNFGDQAPEAALTVRFDEQENGERLELLVTAGHLSLRSVGAAEAEELADRPWTPADEGHTLLTLRRRIDRVSVVVGHRCVLTVWEEAGPGKLSISAPPGIVDEENLYYQPYAPPHFDDDFMRGQQESFGEWQVAAGAWENTALVDNLEFVPKAANSFAFAAHPDSLALVTAGADFWDDYRCAVSIRVVEHGQAGLAFRAQDDSSYYAFVMDFGGPESQGHPSVELIKVVEGTPEILASKPFTVPPGQWYRLSVTMGGPSIEAAVDGNPAFEITDGTFCGGLIGLLAADCETVYFDDAEVREAKGLRDGFDLDGLARWELVEGDWQVEAGGEPGACFLTTAARAPALAVAGRATWADYEYQVDFRPSRGGAFGLCFYWRSSDDYWLWRWQPGGTAHQELVRVKEGEEEVVDRAPLDLTLKDWHTAVLRAGRDHAYVSVDGSRAVEALVPPDSCGKVGVWAARGSRPAFDNVRVEFPPGYVPARLPETMESDTEMKEQFANPAEAWFSVDDEAHRPQKVGMNWNKGEYFGPVDVTFPLANVVAAEGKVTVTIEGDQTAPASGYDLVLSTQANSPKLALELLRGGEALRQAEVVSESGACQVRFGRRGTFVVVYVDDELVVSVRETGQREAAPDQPEETTTQVADDPHTASQAGEQ